MRVLIPVKRSLWILIVSLAMIMAGSGLSILSFEQSDHACAAQITMGPDFTDLAEKLSPAVVNISTTKTVKGRQRNPFGGEMPFGPFGGDEFFRRFFGDLPERESKQSSLGSGFIISDDGFIFTNNHVIERADKIKVKLASGKEYDAEIKGKDPNTDLALIKINPKEKLPFIQFGDSDKLKVGEWVFAIGNPFGLNQTVTAGIVSAKGRYIGAGPYDNFIQTDASINPGNSGGPLFNLAGDAVGINTAIVAQGQGIGFAVPINTAKEILNDLKTKGRVTRGWLGVSVQDITEEMAENLKLKESKGALVGQVLEGEPAEKAGIKSGDIIMDVAGKAVQDTHDLLRIVANLPVGKKIDVTVLRDGEKKKFPVIIAERKERGELARGGKTQEDLGMTVQEITPEMAKHLGLPSKTGTIITQVREGSPADDAGLKAQDIILKVNRKVINSLKDYTSAIETEDRSGTLLLWIKRGESYFFVTLRKEKPH